MTPPLIDYIIDQPKLYQRIFYHLSHKEFLDSALVSKRWYVASRKYLKRKSIKIDIHTLDKLEDNNMTLEDYIERGFKYATDVEIYGWLEEKYVKSEVYDTILNSKLKAKRLTLLGRGEWETCYCPREGSTCGEQYDSVKKGQLTNLEYIHIASPFRITACALLDLVSRSPNLKTIRFYGLVCKHDHYKMFLNKRFYSDLEQIYWPWSTKKHLPTITTLAKRNENLSFLYSTAETACDLLAADTLPNLRFLSLMLNENWNLKPNNHKKSYDFLKKTHYISLANKLEGLEIRTFDLGLDLDLDDETKVKVERVYENYKLTFWEQVAKIPKLKYLGIFGAWEFDKVCRELAKHAIGVEYLKINLLPTSVMTAIDSGDDMPILSMPDGARNLRKLPKLRSLHYGCSEKIANIDSQTAPALKELMDLFWNIDMKIQFTDVVEDLLHNIIKRGSQVGKTYKLNLHVQTKKKNVASFVIMGVPMKLQPGQTLRAKLAWIAESECAKRFGKSVFESFQIWGLEQTGNCRDRQMFLKLESAWRFYQGLYKPSFMSI